jgi:hypothetical protein
MTAKHRYAVYDDDTLVAVVHAANEEEAVRIACAKTDGHSFLKCKVLHLGGGNEEE